MEKKKGNEKQYIQEARRAETKTERNKAKKTQRLAPVAPGGPGASNPDRA